MKLVLFLLGLGHIASWQASYASPAATQLVERLDVHIMRRADTGDAAGQGKLEIKPLPYAYNALQPVISEAIMKLHHDKHLQGYINGYNENLEKHAAAGADLTKQLALEKPLTFNAGGIVNHYLFFDNLAAPNSTATKFDETTTLGKAVKGEYGDVEGLKTAMSAAAATLQGSGWVWLGFDKVSRTLVISTTANQDTLLLAEPLVAIDLWEHAYYLDYKNVRADYVKAIWSVINWQEANKRMDAATAAPKQKRKWSRGMLHV